MNETVDAVLKFWGVIITVGTLVGGLAVAIYRLGQAEKKLEKRDAAHEEELRRKDAEHKAEMDTVLNRITHLEEAKTSTSGRLDAMNASVGELKATITKVEGKIEQQNLATQQFQTEMREANAQLRESSARIQEQIIGLSKQISGGRD